MNQIDIMTRVDGYMALVLLHAPPSMIDSVLSGAALPLSKPCWYPCTALTYNFHAYVYVLYVRRHNATFIASKVRGK